MVIQFIDLCSGIGGFHSGLMATGHYECVGHAEIDPNAAKAYKAIYGEEGGLNYGDLREIDPKQLPDFELLCAGFPCQSFSVAGRRLGFQDTRGTVFFEIARIIAEKRPPFLLLENVPGLLSHDSGRTLTTIFSSLVEMGYHIEWMVLNSKYFGVPQQRRRLYIVGYLDARCAGKVFPLGSSYAKNLKQLIPGAQGQRVYETDGVACTQCASAGGWGGKTGLYFIDMEEKKETCDNVGDFVDRYCTPNMLIKLRQGVGRLVRCESDTGVVSILDPRATSKSYSGKVGQALHKFPKVDSTEEIENFMRSVKSKRYYAE